MEGKEGSMEGIKATDGYAKDQRGWHASLAFRASPCQAISDER